MDRIMILHHLRLGPVTYMDLKHYIERDNGIKGDWDFNFILRQMEEDAIVMAKYDPAKKMTMVRVTQYGLAKLDRVIEQIGELGK